MGKGMTLVVPGNHSTTVILSEAIASLREAIMK
jgi:hypothetical protein